MDKVAAVAQDCLERVWPDLTIVLDVDLKAAAPRLDRELDRMEQKGDSYHARVREGFLELARSQPGFAVVDATADIETVHEEVVRTVQERLEGAP
jgi:dTMP kinase